MMPPDVMNNVASALIAKHVLGEIVRDSVKTDLDRHYFAVALRRGVSDDLRPMSFNDISKLLSVPASSIQQMISEHTLYGNAEGGCKLCEGASEKLRALLIQEKNRKRSEEPMSLFVLLSSASSGSRR